MNAARGVNALIWLWILGILAALIFLLCMTRVGVQVSAAENAVAVNLKAGFLSIRVFPAKEKKAAEKSKKTAAKGEDTGRSKAGKKPLPKPELADIKDAVQTLWPPLKKALTRFGRGIRISPMNISVILGGENDPAAAAQLYGYLQGVIWGGMPTLEKLVHIRDPYIHTDVDFTAAKAVWRGEIGISVRIGTVLAMGIGVGIPALRWFLRFRKKMNQPAAPQDEQAAA